MHYHRWHAYGDPKYVNRSERKVQRTLPDGLIVCTRCSTSKHADDYYSRSGRGGLMAHCKDCHRGMLAENYQSNAGYYQEKHKLWKSENREAVAEQWRSDASKRRTRISALDYDPALNIGALRARDGDYCAYCSSAMDFSLRKKGDSTPDQATLDHVFPVSRGGTHTFDNSVLACRSCNSRKHTRTPAEWLSGARIPISARISE